MSERYTPSELLVCLASRLMEDGATAFIGTGIPMLAASLAQKMHAPNLIPIFEFGGTGAILEKLPLAVGDMRTFNKAVIASGICDIVETAQRGFVEYGFLGGAQIDPFGNFKLCCVHPSASIHRGGNLLETPLEEIGKTEKYAEFAFRKLQLAEECRECRWLPYCRGGCVKDRIIVEGCQKRQNYFCESYKAFFDHSMPRFMQIAGKVASGQQDLNR